MKAPKANIVLWVIVLVLLVLGVILAIGLSLPKGNTPPQETEWKTYRNEQFGFALEYPSTWQVEQFPNHTLGPIINIYKPDQVGGESPPFTHFSEITHVSVYPQGIPTQGLTGQTRPSTLTFQEEITNADDFLLKNGTPFATAANFANPPSSWNESGFIFAHLVIENLEISCLRNGTEIPTVECNVLAGEDVLVRSGSISEEDRAVEERILRSFAFLPQTSETVWLYYYNEEVDTDAQGNVGCSTESVLPVSRSLESENIIEETIKLLLEGEITQSEEDQGFQTEFPHAAFRLLSHEQENGILTLMFTEVPGFTTGGSCRVGLLRAQIEKTALQFPQVEEVRILPEELFQP